MSWLAGVKLFKDGLHYLIIIFIIIYRGDNEWNLIDEPNSLSLDRNSSTLIAYKQLNKNNEFKNNMN